MKSFKELNEELNMGRAHTWAVKEADNLLKGKEGILDWQSVRVGRKFVEIDIPLEYYKTEEQKKKINAFFEKIIKKFKGYTVQFSGIDKLRNFVSLNLENLK